MTDNDSHPRPAPEPATLAGEQFQFRAYVPPGTLWNFLLGGDPDLTAAIPFLRVALRDDDGDQPDGDYERGDVDPTSSIGRFSGLLFDKTRQVWPDEIIDAARKAAEHYTSRPTRRPAGS